MTPLAVKSEARGMAPNTSGLCKVGTSRGGNLFAERFRSPSGCVVRIERGVVPAQPSREARASAWCYYRSGNVVANSRVICIRDRAALYRITREYRLVWSRNPNLARAARVARSRLVSRQCGLLHIRHVRINVYTTCTLHSSVALSVASGAGY